MESNISQEIKEYTIIYAEQVGYNRGQTITKYQHLACYKEKLSEYVEHNIGWGNVWFIFEGFCKELEE